MKELIKKGIDSVSPILDKAVNDISQNASIFKEVINGLPMVMSLEKVESKKNEEFDEKHYFVIPFKMSEYGFALHTMRSLPKGVPEINKLPKKRVFHFANDHAELALKNYMVDSAKELVREKHEDNKNTLESLANSIDALDNKLTYGMLLIGGIAAIFNPLVGVGIAAKAMLPGAAGIVTKYGLRPAGEKISEKQLEKDCKEAEKNVVKQFEGAETHRVVNPILEELELALRTTESEHDPLTDPNLANGSIPELPNERWRELTEIAVYHVYKDVYEDASKHKEASLGPEDIRWLKTIFNTITS